MIVVAGEALIDLVAEGGDGYHAVVGGSPGNVAIGLARLGRPVRLLARLSEDPFGRQIRDHLSTNGVDLAWAIDAAEPTSLAIASLDDFGRATYAFYLSGTADWQWTLSELPRSLDGVTAVHSGSLALAMAPGAKVLEEMIAATPVTVSIDLNLRPSICGDWEAERKRVERQVRYAQIVKASDEDLAWLYPDRTIAEVAASWQQAGVSCAVITLGGDGVYVLTASGAEHRQPAVPIAVVDSVGAGDAFTAGLLAALDESGALGADPVTRLGAVTNDLWAEMIAYASMTASITCGRRGPDPPPAGEVRAALGLRKRGRVSVRAAQDSAVM